MYLFNPLLFTDWLGMMMEADAVPGDLHETVIGLEKCYEEEDIAGLVVVIDGFEINEKFRGKGYGSKFLSKALEDLYFMNVELVGLIPGFYGEIVQDNHSRNSKIQDFYSKHSFKIIDPKKNLPVMAKYLHYRD